MSNKELGAAAATPVPAASHLAGVNCPQCGAPLPRRAKWFSTECESCGVLVQREVDRVQRLRFKSAAERLRLDERANHKGELRLFGAEALALGPVLADETECTVRMARRFAPHSQQLVLKIGHDAKGNSRLVNTLEVLTELRASDHPHAAYFRRRLPAPYALRMLSLIDQTEPRQALALCHLSGVWGPLSAVHENYRTGLDPRHVIWIWRRVLEVLDFVHGQGFAHGAVCLEHMMVQPRDHGVVLGGWGVAARFSPQTREAAIARDLQQLAFSMRALIGGIPAQDQLPQTPAYVPKPLAELLERICTSEHETAQLAALGVHTALGRAAREAYGAPKFIAFSPTRT